MALLQFQRESLLRKVEGVSDEDAARPMVPTGTSLHWLVKHTRRAEVIWVLLRFAGQPGDFPDDTVGPDDRLADAVEAYRATWADVDAIVDAEPDLERPCVDTGGQPAANLRWVLMHLLEETARHAGHADILRELLDGETGR